MSSYTLAPVPVFQFFTAPGVPAAGYLLYTYEAGTQTLLATASDVDGTPHENPIVLNAGGFVSTTGGAIAGLYLQAAAYDFELKTAAGASVWTRPDVVSVGLVTSGVHSVYTFAGNDA